MMPEMEEVKDAALKYDKPTLARMAQMGQMSPTIAVMAGMMRDRIVQSEMKPPEPPTVAEEVMQPMGARMGLGAIAPQGQPQMAQAQGIDQIPVPDQMFEPQGMAGGGIVAFSSGNLVNYSQFGPMGKRIEEEEKLREAYLGKDQSVADLMSYIQGLEGKSKERAERMFNLRLVQAGLGMAAGSSPYALQNIAQGAIPAIAGYAGDIEKQGEAEFGRKKVLAELGGRARAEKIGVLGEARRAEQAATELAQKTAEGASNRAAKIEAANIQAGKGTDMGRYVDNFVIAAKEDPKLKDLSEARLKVIGADKYLQLFGAAQARAQAANVQAAAATERAQAAVQQADVATQRLDVTERQTAEQAVDKQLAPGGNRNIAKEYNRFAREDREANAKSGAQPGDPNYSNKAGAYRERLIRDRLNPPSASGAASTDAKPQTAKPAAPSATAKPMTTLPPGSIYIGTQGGKPVYQLPDGRQMIQQ